MSGPTSPAAHAKLNKFRRSMFKLHKLPSLIIRGRFLFKSPNTRQVLIFRWAVARAWNFKAFSVSVPPGCTARASPCAQEGRRKLFLGTGFL